MRIDSCGHFSALVGVGGLMHWSLLAESDVGHQRMPRTGGRKTRALAHVASAFCRWVAYAVLALVPWICEADEGTECEYGGNYSHNYYVKNDGSLCPGTPAQGANSYDVWVINCTNVPVRVNVYQDGVIKWTNKECAALSTTYCGTVSSPVATFPESTVSSTFRVQWKSGGPDWPDMTQCVTWDFFWVRQTNNYCGAGANSTWWWASVEGVKLKMGNCDGCPCSLIDARMDMSLVSCSWTSTYEVIYSWEWYRGGFRYEGNSGILLEDSPGHLSSVRTGSNNLYGVGLVSSYYIQLCLDRELDAPFVEVNWWWAMRKKGNPASAQSWGPFKVKVYPCGEGGPPRSYQYFTDVWGFNCYDPTPTNPIVPTNDFSGGSWEAEPFTNYPGGGFDTVDASNNVVEGGVDLDGDGVADIPYVEGGGGSNAGGGLTQAELVDALRSVGNEYAGVMPGTQSVDLAGWEFGLGQVSNGLNQIKVINSRRTALWQRCVDAAQMLMVPAVTVTESRMWSFTFNFDGNEVTLNWEPYSEMINLIRDIILYFLSLLFGITFIKAVWRLIGDVSGVV